MHHSNGRYRRLLLGTAVLLASLVLRARTFAQEPVGEPSARDIVVAYNTGLRFSIAPGIIIPTNGGSVGFSIAGDLRYGFELGPVVLAPGARLAGYFPSGRFGLAALATLRLTVPIGPVGPFVVGGVGPGYLSEPSHAGAAYLGGGGLMVHIGTRFAFGAEVMYTGLTGSNFRSLLIGPTLMFGI